MKIDRTANIANDKDELYCQDKGKIMEKARIATEGNSQKTDIKQVYAELNKFSSVFDMESFNEVKNMLSEVINSLTVSNMNISEVVKEFPSEEIISLSKMAFKDDSSTK